MVDPKRFGMHKPGKSEQDYVRRRADIVGGKEAGDEFDSQRFAVPGILGLALWIGACYLMIWLGLSLAQPAPLRPRWLQKDP